jgi:hypothetical protein
VSGCIEHALIRKDPTRCCKVLKDGPSKLGPYFHGITETWIAPGAPSPPTDLIA